MKNIKLYLIALLAITLGLTSCDEDEDLIAQRLADNPLPTPTTGTPGTLDFSKYVSIGNSLTAGFADGALYTDAQNQSFPALFAQQLAITGVGGGAFNQPDINSANGFSSAGADGLPGTADDLGRFELSLSLLRPVPTSGEPPTAFAGDKSALNNFGVPGMRLIDASDASLAVRNPLYGRFASAPGTSTVLGDALAASPTFFSFWLGNNDILGYAAAGGVDPSAITSVTDFQTALTNSLGALAQSGAQGVVMTIPPITLIPYFRAVPYNAVPLTDANLVATLNGAFAGLNAALDGLAQFNLLTQEQANARKVSYSVGANPILMHDDALTNIGPLFDVLLGANAITQAQRDALQPFVQSRPATANDLPTLRSASVIGTSVGGSATLLNGITVPLEDQYILSASEVQTVVGTRAAFNGTIAAVVAGVNATANGAITLVDVQPAYYDLAGLDAQTAAFLSNPLQGSVPALDPFLTQMATAAAARADGVLGIEVDGVNLAPDFGPNGVMSTDGIHPNPRGNGIIVNLIIDALNSSKNSTIPRLNVLALRSVLTTN